MRTIRRTTSKPAQFQHVIDANSVNSYIDLDLVTSKAIGALGLTTPTGLPNTADLFGFTLSINGVLQTVSFQGNLAQTIGSLLNEINADLTDGTAILLPDDKRIRIVATAAGATPITAPATDELSSEIGGKVITSAEWLNPMVGGGALFRISSAPIDASPIPMVSVLSGNQFLPESAFTYTFDAVKATIAISPATAFTVGDEVNAIIGLYNRN